MDSFDYQRSAVPARLSSQRIAPNSPQRFEGSASEAGPSTLSVKAVLRAARRYWWLILALWTVGSAGVGAGVYLKVKPVYRATSWLKVEPTEIDLYDMRRSGNEPYMQTHVTLIKSNNVLETATKDPKVAALPRIKGSPDPIKELERSIGVGIQPGTYIIEVAMVSQSPDEAAKVVNAVVDAFLAANSDWATGATKNQIDKLSGYKHDLELKIKSKEEEIRTKIGQGNTEQLTLVDPLDPEASTSSKIAEQKADWTVDAYRQMLKQLSDTKMELLLAESSLNNAQNLAQEVKQFEGPAVASRANTTQVEARIKADPEVISLQRKVNEARNLAKKIHDDTRGQGDPAEDRARKKAMTLNQDLQDLREQKRAQFQEMAQGVPGENAPEVEVNRLGSLVRTLRNRKATLEDEVSRLKIKNTKKQGDELDVRFCQEERSELKSMEGIIHRKLESMLFESTSEERIKRITEARAEGTPVADKRMQYMAMAPVGILGAVLGLVILLEIRSGRVGDTEILASRVRHEVFSIAPLPSPRQGIGTDGKAEQRLARFVQSLDHLRVALCEGGTQGEGRCVMITSASGGEGKTTLSAHLAARCANAGTATLLIDADLRRASLGRLLDVPPGLGLGDVLAGEADLDASLLTVQAGGFHFLSAGTPGIDPTRVLKSTRLAELIGQLRQMYDLIIIDTPPVLPVADALIMGRWADGAVMAARYDASRLPMVERANRQIIAAGIPVLGVVVNGVKGADQAYGNYSYGYGYPGREEPVARATDQA